jgi:Xaa-Pro aminopeptidase
MPDRLKEVFRVVREAHDRAIEAVRPGIKARAVDAVARGIIQKAGYGKLFNHGLGHGLGIAVHELPRVNKITKEVLKPGMVFTIEPGIYLPGVGGVRLEDDVVVTETGCEVLSRLPVEFS